MSYPILYESTETEFQSMGFGFLSDCISCTVTEERNGSYELEMEYPISGAHYSDITQRRIILAKPNYLDDEQPFRIYMITRPIGGIVTVNAQHISYDLSGYPVKPFSISNIQGALAGLVSNSMVTCPFTLTSTRTTNATFKVDVPSSIRYMLGGHTGSLLDVYGGEYHFDKFSVSLENARGEDRGVVIRYGKNLTDLKQEENCLNVYTGVVSYWADSEGNEIHGDVINASGTYDFTRILTVDCSQEYQSKPTSEQLNTYSTNYIKNNNIGIPDVNLTVSFIQNDSTGTTDYFTDNNSFYFTDNNGNRFIDTQYPANTSVNLCDTVTVWFEQYGVDATAKCIKTIWNVLQERYDSVELGDAKSTVAETLSTIQAIKETIVTYSKMDIAVNHATKLITGNLGGYVMWHDSNDDGYPDEFLVMDKMDISTATKVWRWNLSGLGYSSSGYAGTYKLAMTSDGRFCADFITFGTMDGALIKAGSIEVDRLTAGAKTAITKELSDRLSVSEADLLKYKQQVKLNDSGVEVIAGDGESLTQADGLHILTKQSDGKYHEIARFTANDSWVDNLTVSNFAKIGSHRMETIKDTEYGATAETDFTAFFWIGDV